MNNQQTNQQSQANPQALAITKALAYTENGGTPNISNPSAGPSGEMKSIFQFEPGTWKTYAQQISGNANLPMTAQNESMIAYSKVNDWLQKGYSAEQIASMWNAGPGEPNAYTGKFSDGSSSQGTNAKYGVKYDVPGYAKRVLNYTQQFESQGNQNTQTNTGNNNSNTQTNPTQNQPLSSNPPLKRALTMIKTANDNAKKKKGKSKGMLGSGSSAGSTGGLVGLQSSQPPFSGSQT